MQQLIRQSIVDDSEPVEWNIPDQLLPSGKCQIVFKSDLYACRSEVGAEHFQARCDARGFSVAAVFSDGYEAIVEVADVSGPDLVGAEKAQSSQYSVGPCDGGNLFFRTQPVLQGEYDAIVLDQMG